VNPSLQEWERRCDASLIAAQERRARTHADPVSIAGWVTAILISLAFWVGITIIAVVLL
jgi:predicted DNA-binding ribbon-helix-helix protein